MSFPSAIPAAPSDEREEDYVAPRASHWEVFRGLLPLVWPANRPDLRARVVLAFGVLLIAKLVTVAVPIFYKDATDVLTAAAGTGADPAHGLAIGIVMLIVAYGTGRVLMMALTQVRDVIFTEVGQNAVRQLNNRTFEHLHRLSLRFHLERRTGGLSRVIERATRGVELIIRMGILNVVPTALELLLVCGMLLYYFDWRYVAIMLATVVVYMWFTFSASERRIAIRREMNESDTEANTKAIDSLLNFETVKYFGNEELEARRFDVSMARYEQAAIKTFRSLGVLNTGQALIFTVGMTACMVLAARGIVSGGHTIGEFVMINVLLLQLYMPLNFMGMVYREIKQGLVDLEAMFALLDERPEIKDRPGAKPLVADKGEIRFDDVTFSYDEGGRQVLKNVSFDVPAGKMVAIVGPSGAGKSTIGRILFRFYDIEGGRVTIDGQDIRDVTQKSLRQAIGVVPQDSVLFNDTIFYNIKYGRPDATRRGGLRRRAPGPDRRLHPHAAAGLQDHGRRARIEAIGRREAARRHRAHHPQRPAHSHPRRGDERARQPHREGNPGRARSGGAQSHLAGHRPSPVDHRARRQHPGPRQGALGRAGHACRADGGRRSLRQPLDAAAPGGEGARGIGACAGGRRGAGVRAEDIRLMAK